MKRNFDVTMCFRGFYVLKGRCRCGIVDAKRGHRPLMSNEDDAFDEKMTKHRGR